MNAILLAAIDPDRVKPGWLGLVVVLAIAVVTFVLWRSMNRQLRKIHFDDKAEGDPPPPRKDPGRSS